MTSFPKLKKFFAKKFIENASVVFSLIFLFSGIVFAATTWSPGNPPQAAPGEGNVELPFFWTKNGPAKIFYNSGDVGIGTSSPTVKLEVDGNIIADAPTENNHVVTKEYVDAAGGGSGGPFTLIGGVDDGEGGSTPPSCPDGYFSAMDGYWNCNDDASNCFCGQLAVYNFISGARASSTSSNRWRHYRCVICVP